MNFDLEKLRGRSNRSKAGLFLGSMLLVASASVTWADVIEDLQGVWVDESTECTMVFEKIKGQVKFKSRTFASDNGFIITGNKAKGPVGGSCTISPVNEKNGRFAAQLSCSDAVVSKKFSWSFRIVDETHFERIDERFGAYSYKKCVF